MAPAPVFSSADQHRHQDFADFHAFQSAAVEHFLALPLERREHLLRERAAQLARRGTATASMWPPHSNGFNLPGPSYAAAPPSMFGSQQQAHSGFSQPPSAERVPRSRAYMAGQQVAPSASTAASQQQQQTPTQPKQVHRVYVLSCATCNTFVSDRGMRAVLLLKPNIILFSTDASPCNAGPMYPDAPASLEGESHVERTCDCLTQSLGCYGCGSTIGYHIVSPCARCTASVARHQRTANHHRFVFHHNEVVARERKYWPGERGVVSSRHRTVAGACTGSHATPITSRSSTPSGSPRVDATAPAVEDVGEKDPAAPTGRSTLEGLFPDVGPRHALSRSIHRAQTPSSAQQQASSAASAACCAASCELQPGDTVYWHNLVTGGERVEPIDPDSRPPRAIERPGR